MSDEVKDPIGDKRDQKGRFADGNKGGPGRPVGTLSLTGLLRKHLDSVPRGEQQTRGEIFVKKTLEKAMRGNPASEKLVWNYIDGLPKQSLDLTSGGKPIPILGGATQTPESKEPEEETEE